MVGDGGVREGDYSVGFDRCSDLHSLSLQSNTRGVLPHNGNRTTGRLHHYLAVVRAREVDVGDLLHLLVLLQCLRLGLLLVSFSLVLLVAVDGDDLVLRPLLPLLNHLRNLSGNGPAPERLPPLLPLAHRHRTVGDGVNQAADHLARGNGGGGGLVAAGAGGRGGRGRENLHVVVVFLSFLAGSRGRKRWRRGRVDVDNLGAAAGRLLRREGPDEDVGGEARDGVDPEGAHLARHGDGDADGSVLLHGKVGSLFQNIALEGHARVRALDGALRVVHSNGAPVLGRSRRGKLDLHRLPTLPLHRHQALARRQLHDLGVSPNHVSRLLLIMIILRLLLLLLVHLLLCFLLLLLLLWLLLYHRSNWLQPWHLRSFLNKGLRRQRCLFPSPFRPGLLLLQHARDLPRDAIVRQDGVLGQVLVAHRGEQRLDCRRKRGESARVELLNVLSASNVGGLPRLGYKDNGA